jgi:hypothetical protein
LKGEPVVLVEGKLEKDGENSKILVESIVLLEEFLKRIKKIQIRVKDSPTLIWENRMADLRGILKKHEGPVPVSLAVDLGESNRKVILEIEGGIKLNNSFLEDIQTKFGNTDFVDLV